MSKLVKESLNQSFERESNNKLKNLGIGKINLIKDWLKKYEIEYCVINKDLTLYSPKNVNLSYESLTEIPSYIQFERIDGDFSVRSNELESLRGCPKYVMRSFSCSDNNLKSLEYAPLYVGFNFWADRNPIPQNEIDKYKEYINDWQIKTDYANSLKIIKFQ